MYMSRPALIGLRAVGVGAALDLAVGVPVADHEALEAHPPLQHVGQQALVAVCLTPFQLENEAITVRMPASMAGG
jgi:hypothetical protein